MKKVAICYWGMSRSFNSVYNNHKQHIYDIILENDMLYDIYVHTWKVKNLPDYDKFENITILIEEQDSLRREIDENFHLYWYKHLYDKYGTSSLEEWDPERVKNGLYAMTSLKKVSELVSSKNITYDYIIFVRPDLILGNNIPINKILNLSDDAIIVDETHWGGKEVFGIDDKLAIIKYGSHYNYSNRIDKTQFYRKNIGRIAGEHYVGWIVQKYYKTIVYHDFKLELRR